jgi:hypothetical protein
LAENTAELALPIGLLEDKLAIFVPPPDGYMFSIVVELDLFFDLTIFMPHHMFSNRCPVSVGFG